MPPPLDPEDVYAATRNGLAPAVRDDPELTYVPNGAANTVSVVDPKTRYGTDMYALDIMTGETTATVRGGAGPQGLTVHPQPGRYPLGHTGILR